MEPEVFRNLGIAIGLGLLIGLQRQWADQQVAGIRTFPLITLLGALCGLLSAAGNGGGLLIATGLIAVVALFWIGNRMRIADLGEDIDPGLTTEMAALVMFLVGAMVMTGFEGVAVVVGGVVAVLLHWKQHLHRLVERVGQKDLRAIVRLVIIGMVILPVLPNRDYGPYQVLNPFEIWLMVVLIVGISMAAYVVQRLLGAQVGTLLAGFFGGIISSTATTVSYAGRSRARPREVPAAAVVVMIASTVVFVRVLIEIVLVAPSMVGQVAPPLGVMMAFMGITGLIAFFVSRSALDAEPDDEPPADLKAAVIFGLLYAAVLFAVAAVKEHFGDAAMYAVAAVSGLTDMDAITLSSAQLMKAGTLEAATGWQLILVGAMANLVFKLGAVAVLGHRRLFLRLALLFAISAAGGVSLLLFWPG